MATRRIDMSKNAFFGLLTENQQFQRNYYLNHFSKFPKQGKPSRDPPHSGYLKSSSQQPLSKIQKAEAKHEIRWASPSYETVRIKSKIRDLLFNANGSRLICNTKEAVFVLSPYNLTTELTINLKALQVLVHPNSPEIFAAVTQGLGALEHIENATARCACVLKCYQDANSPYYIKFYDVRTPTSTKLHQDKPVLEIASLHKDVFSQAYWKPDGSAILSLDRSDYLSVLPLAKVMASPTSKSLTALSENRNEDLKNMRFDRLASRKLKETVNGITFDGLGELLLVYCADGMLHIYPGNPINLDVEPLKEKIRSASINCCAADKGGSFIATGGSDHTVNLFDLDTASIVGVYPKLEGQISCIATSCDGELLCWGTKDSSFFLTEDTSYSRNREDTYDKQECYITVAGTNPTEIYYQYRTASTVVACDFHPSRYILAYGCDYDTLPRPSGSNYKMHPIGILTFE